MNKPTFDIKQLKLSTIPDPTKPVNGYSTVHKFCIQNEKTIEAKLRDIDLNYMCFLHSSPTGNCQLGALTYANNMFAYENAREIYNQLVKLSPRPIYLLDVTNTIASQVDTIFKKSEIISKTPYSSTNGSQMVIYLINNRGMM